MYTHKLSKNAAKRTTVC